MSRPWGLLTRPAGPDQRALWALGVTLLVLQVPAAIVHTGGLSNVAGLLGYLLLEEAHGPRP